MKEPCIVLYDFYRFSLHIQNKSLHLQCLPFETGEKARQITLLRAFFMSEALPIISYSSVPCGVLMHPQPVSGGKQRGAELFCFLSVIIINFIIHFNCLPK